MDTLGLRLKNERKRLGLTQVAFAKIGGVEPNAQVHYESGHRSPKADYLQRITDAGVDVTYLFSGPSPAEPELEGPRLALSAAAECPGSHPAAAATTDVDASSMIRALHLSLAATTDLIVSIAGCLSSPDNNNRQKEFDAQAASFRCEAERFINHALSRMNCSV